MDSEAAAKPEGFKKLMDLAGIKDFTSEAFLNTFKEIGDSPEKFRAFLNVCFIPSFKPTFVADQNYAVSGLQDVEFLGNHEPAPAQKPRRMFDIDTGNLVEWPDIGGRGQYCMLSHRWKGEELTLKYIKEARAKDLDDTKEAIRVAKANGESPPASTRKDDVQLALDRCKIDIREQEDVVKELYLADHPGAPPGDFSLGLLLDKRLHVRDVENTLQGAKNTAESTRTKLRFAEMESEIFSELLGKARRGIDDKMKTPAQPKAPSETLSTGLPHPGGEGEKEKSQNPDPKDQSMVGKVKRELDGARSELEDAREKHSSAEEDIKFFKKHNRVRDALDEMVVRLQRWKSVIKIHSSIEQAQKIFSTKLFQYREKCYLWTDTCCIDKLDAGELSESLSLMGDWYANAEFCLVYLDTPSSEADSSPDWRLFLSKEKRRPEPFTTEPSGNLKIIQSFEGIAENKPEWSTRAWTLQELVMSKTTYYANSKWKDLSRPAESLGYFYHLIPFISQYTRRDTMNMYCSSSSSDTPLSDRLSAFLDNLKLSEILKGHAVPEELMRIGGDSIQGAHTNPASVASESRIRAQKEARRVEKAHQIIALLDGLGIRFPKDMTLETATSEMARAVYLASADLISDDSTGGKTLLDGLHAHLKHLLPEPDYTKPSSTETSNPTEALPLVKVLSADEELRRRKKEQEKEAQHAINFLLQCLVNETLDLILYDRRYVSEFGKVEQLSTWQKGTRRSGFSAQSVLAASGTRKAAVATDRAYALMGVLGVRFPTFSAEGYPMAVARLLDHVVITHNDISVFNWTGMEHGSPVRGRSLYPSSHAAFGNQDDRSTYYNNLLSAQAQNKMNDVMETYHKVIFVLRQAIDTIKAKDNQDLPFVWISLIFELFKVSDFHRLKPKITSLGKIIGFITKHCEKERAWRKAVKEAKEAEEARAKAQAEEAKAKEAANPSSPSESFVKSLSFSSATSSFSSALSTPTLSMPSSPLSMSGFKLTGGSKKEPESGADSSKKGGKLSGFKGISRPSFGLSKQTASEPIPEAKPPVVESPPVESPPPATPLTPLPPIPSPGEKPQAPWDTLEDGVVGHLNYIVNPADPEKKKFECLPDPVQTVIFNLPSPADIHINKPGTHPGSGLEPDSIDNHESTISPNPIIVNNSGIEGLFDIQRVIVTMIEHDKLRARVAKAATPHDKISGWCSISTGFARVIASFSCEKRLLEQELDAVEGVESKVLMEQNKGEDETRAAKLMRDVAMNVPVPGLGGGGVKVEDEEQDGGGKGEEKQADINKYTEEERLVSRMIDFIQEPQLQLVAGEWVLARFSGVPGARWFFCHLELGSAPGQFYGHRIATGEIDFANSTPEQGLVKAWQTYMERKKRKMCHILDKFLKSRMRGKEGREKLEETKRTMLKAAKDLDSISLLGRDTGIEEEDDDEDSEADEKAELLEKDGSGNGEAGSFDGRFSLDKLLDMSKDAAKSFGEYTISAVVEKFFELHAQHMDDTLSTMVLKRTPKTLQTAVENMNDNRNFLPAMFHSSTKMHMF
ncbi:hypothetical protein B0T25DRAFT_227009 [Lasiosphaeria hispida]|uniref:Heterokaryon incompatibility domain-containing protein n=1 Tax=Lasiosphaeria hispida TaxID=260671 RepID=A0AAJ0MBK4_9PEZI|nr:hypothetical protein B0T25DRAFT_227009 [Lasiosphaeria hispida]